VTAWKELYRLEANGRKALARGYVLFAAFLLALGAGLAFALFLAARAVHAAGGLKPYLGALYHAHGCGTLMALIVLVLVLRGNGPLLAFLWRTAMDGNATPRVWEGEVEALREETGDRGSTRCLLVFKGRAFVVTKALFDQLAVGQPLRAEVLPNAPTLLCLETQEPAP